MTTPGYDVGAFVARTERLLLGGEPRYTRREVCEQAGVPLDDARTVWRALGFATTADDEAVFTDDDVAALRTVADLRATGAVDLADVAAIARLMGRSFYRLASAEGHLLLGRLLSDPDALRSPDAAFDLVTHLAPAVATLQDYVWRRQMAAFLQRLAGDSADSGTPAGSGADPGPTTAVGFADMAGFTTRTRRSTETELRDLLEEFERLTTDVVAQHGGRVVKTIGDEVLFSADGAQDGALIALGLHDAVTASTRVPDLRIGLACGAVVTRMGDVFGATVNIASRLTSLARPGWTLVDRETAGALAADGRFALRPRRPESVRGYHHLRQWRLQRADAPERPRRRR